MNIVYLGTPDFAVAPLKAIVESGKYNVVAVVTNCDKPVGRKKILTAPPVKIYAESKGIKVFQYEKIRCEGVEDMKSLAPDLMITCAFGQILSQEILDIPKFGVFNIHASLLPKYRGASPVHAAILNGEEQTGITIMKTDIGIDTGDIILSELIDIDKEETCGQLFDRLSILGAESILKALSLLETNKITFTKQNNQLATLSKMIKKQDAFINFNDSAKNIVNKIRAYNPSPIAFVVLDKLPFKIYKARIEKQKTHLQVGEIEIQNGKIFVGCKDCAIELLIVQKAGGKAICANDFLRGNTLPKFFKEELND